MIEKIKKQKSKNLELISLQTDEDETHIQLNLKKACRNWEDTYKRITKLDGIKNPILICNEEHRFIAAEQMREINIKPNKICVE